MKYLSFILAFGFVSILDISCKKNSSANTEVPRKVQFSLYTDKDFSANNDNIIFTLSIQKSTNEILWDSILPSMKIKDIPDSAHKISMQKLVPGNDASLLKVGFYYVIENVGSSWYLDSFNVGETLKIVDFNFQ